MSAPQRRRLEHAGRTLRCDGTYDDRNIRYFLTFASVANEQALLVLQEVFQTVHEARIAARKVPPDS